MDRRWDPRRRWDRLWDRFCDHPPDRWRDRLWDASQRDNETDPTGGPKGDPKEAIALDLARRVALDTFPTVAGRILGLYDEAAPTWHEQRHHVMNRESSDFWRG